MTKLAIVVPAYNEEKAIYGLLLNLYNQYQRSGTELLPRGAYCVVVVDNRSTDDTVGVCQRFARAFPDFDLTVIEERQKGVVPARITGFGYVRETRPDCQYLAGGDADTRYDSRWVAAILDAFERTEAKLLAFTGGFSLDFWGNVPRLANRYLRDVGTIMFDERTIEFFGLRGRKFPITHGVFQRFGRRLTEACFAVRSADYFRLGGIRREFYDVEKTREVYSEGWRLSLAFEWQGEATALVPHVPYATSARRLLEEPEKVFAADCYSGEMADLRGAADVDVYARLEAMAERADMYRTRRHVVDYYILMSAITRPALLEANRDVFGASYEPVRAAIESFRSQPTQPSGNEILELAEKLGAEHYSAICASFTGMVQD